MMEETKLREIEKITNIFMQLDYARTPSSILAYLMLEEEDSVTFNKIIEQLGLSKASTSTGLRFLEDKGMISYHSRLNSRERFIHLNLMGIVTWLTSRMAVIEEMKHLFTEVADHHASAYGEQFRTLAHLYDKIDAAVNQVLEDFDKGGV
ncbi:hypothetical protein ACVRW7_03165 [Streptococcus ratti]|nr:hypothetical protein [Streptococcus ratti]QEY07327.1 hypothetical protein FY406_06615 [Streptococcus ratti]